MPVPQIDQVEMTLPLDLEDLDVRARNRVLIRVNQQIAVWSVQANIVVGAPLWVFEGDILICLKVFGSIREMDAEEVAQFEGNAQSDIPIRALNLASTSARSAAAASAVTWPVLWN